MEPLYSIQRKPLKNTTPVLEGVNGGVTLCAVSSGNVVAFTTLTELDDLHSSTWGNHVYVADINTPWFSYKVVSSKYQICTLEWDIQGRMLMVCDTAGNVQIFSPKNNMLNEWYLQYYTSFPGEHIIKAAFFHNGRKIAFNQEKKDQMLYSEKFQHLRFAPSVKQFGFVPSEGALVISTTGMLGAILLPPEHSITLTSVTNANANVAMPAAATASNVGSNMAPNATSNSEKVQPITLITATESLGLTREHVTTVDICYGKNGHFLVAVSSGLVFLPIQCYRVSIKKSDEKLSIISQALPSFFVKDVNKDGQGYSVVKLQWVSREDADSLVVAANCPIGCLVEVWGLSEKNQSIHKIFQNSNKGSGGDTFKTVIWKHQNDFRHTGQVVSVTTSKLNITASANAPSYVIVALNDNTIHCMYRDSMKTISTTSLNQCWRQTDEPPSKQLKIDTMISNIEMSWLGNILLAVDTQGQMCLYRLASITDPSTPMSISFATILLEYCMITGFDWLDLLLVLNHQIVDSVCDRLTEGFNRQPSCSQQYLYVHYLSIKESLYRMTMLGQYKAQDLSHLLMLHSVSTAFKGLLRTSDLSSHDKGPAESLAHLISENQTDVDKVLFHLEAKEFAVEPSTLQSLQTLIQWVADLALHVLVRLPDSRWLSPLKSGGYEFIKDVKAVNTLRELIVIIRIWGLLQVNCLPVFTRSQESLDILPLIFRLLGKLSQNPNDLEDGLLDECCLLPSQVLIPNMYSNQSQIAIASPCLAYQNLPINLEYGVEPESLEFTPDIQIINNGLLANTVMDALRYTHLGTDPMLIKKCTRCGANSSLTSVSRTAAVRAWEQRWSKSCRCGGFWRVSSKDLS